MVSSINHHISVLKLRVHPLYMECIANGTTPNVSQASQEWASPVLHRTRWYDLFDANDRVELMRGLWAIMGYQMRAIEKEDAVMSD
jgi:hypothetical protein